MSTKFLVIVPYHNAAKFLPECVASLSSQSNKGWRAVFSDDASTDGGSSLVPSDPRFSVRVNGERLTALANIHEAILSAGPDDDEVVCILDGDDFLTRPDALDIVAALYSNPDTMLTYGQYVWPNGMAGHCRPYTREAYAALRTGGYWASHLRTFKFGLYREMMRQDPGLTCYRDDSGDFFRTCYDIAIMTPLMEIAGFESIAFNPRPVYYYRQHPANDHAIDHAAQRRDEAQLFAKAPFRRM